jgi:hypothetical protein
MLLDEQEKLEERRGEEKWNGMARTGLEGWRMV